MSGKTDRAKGRAKEAAGILTGNKDLEAEGKADRHSGEAKEHVDHAKDKVKGKFDEAADRAIDGLDPN